MSLSEVDANPFEGPALLVGDPTLDPVPRLQADRDLGGLIGRPRLDLETLRRRALGPNDNFLADGSLEEIIEPEPAIRPGLRLADQV